MLASVDPKPQTVDECISPNTYKNGKGVNSLASLLLPSPIHHTGRITPRQFEEPEEQSRRYARERIETAGL